MIISRPPLPVIPPDKPTDFISPRLPLIANKSFLSCSLATSILNNSLPNCLIFSRFLFPNFSAKSALYAVNMQLELGFLPTNQLGNVSVTHIDLPCLGGTLKQILTSSPASIFITTFSQTAAKNLWNLVGLKIDEWT